MTPSGSRWAIVLAGGEGERLRSLTCGSDGVAVPKQFCSLRSGESSLLQRAVARACAVVPVERVMVVVNEAHRRYWEPQLLGRDCSADAGSPEPVLARNVLVQPRGRGTGAGVALPLLTILERDPGAEVALFPSDHHIEREAVFGEAVEAAFDAVAITPQRVALLGIEPGWAETEYGWIVPRPSVTRSAAVASFVEKPSASTARALLEMGARWNSLVLAARGRALRELVDRQIPDVAGVLSLVVRSAPVRRELLLRKVYQTLRVTDFSVDVLQSAATRLSMIGVPTCGWSDLGTPTRVRACLSREDAIAPRPATRQASRSDVPLALDRAAGAGVAPIPGVAQGA